MTIRPPIKLSASEFRYLWSKIIPKRAIFVVKMRLTAMQQVVITKRSLITVLIRGASEHLIYSISCWLGDKQKNWMPNTYILTEVTNLGYRSYCSWHNKSQSIGTLSNVLCKLPIVLYSLHDNYTPRRQVLWSTRHVRVSLWLCLHIQHTFTSVKVRLTREEARRS